MAAVTATTEYQYCLITFGILVTLSIYLIFIIELYSTYSRIKKQNKASRNNVSLVVAYYFAFPLFIYLCYIINGTCNIIIWFKIWENCMAMDLTSIISLVLSKAFLYEFFIVRLHIIYQKSFFEYNIKILLFLAIFIFCYISITIILIIINYEVILVHHTVINACSETIPFFIHVYAALSDQVVTFTAVYLFTKPLIHLIKSTPDINDTEAYADHDSLESTKSQQTTINTNTKKELQDEYKVIVKVAALSFISSIATFLVLIWQVAVFPNYLLYYLGMLINTICVMLMNSTYIKMYQMVCCLTNRLCEKCVICICCLGGYVDSKTEKELETYVDSKDNLKFVIS